MYGVHLEVEVLGAVDVLCPLNDPLEFNDNVLCLQVLVTWASVPEWLLKALPILLLELEDGRVLCLAVFGVNSRSPSHLVSRREVHY